MECARPWVWSGQEWNDPSFQSALEIGCGLVEVEKERLEIVHARDEEPMAEGVLVVRVIGGLEYPHRILALSIVGSMALAAELVAGLCGQILGHDDLRLIGRLRVLRTRSVATLAGYIQVFVVPVGDDGLCRSRRKSFVLIVRPVAWHPAQFLERVLSGVDQLLGDFCQNIGAPTSPFASTFEPSGVPSCMMKTGMKAI